MSAAAGLAQGSGLTVRIDVPVVSLDVAVTDEAGAPVEGLTAADFEVFENGEPQEVQYFGPSAAPYHTYLLFDASGSTRHQWDFMRDAVGRFVERAKPQDRIAVGVFDSRIETLSGWEETRERHLAALDRLIEERPGGGTTELYAAIRVVLERPFEDIQERRAILVLTDGRETSLYHEAVQRGRVPAPEDDRAFRNLYRAAQDRRIPIYFIAVNTDRNLEPNVGGADEYENLRFIFRDSPLPDRYLQAVRSRMERLAEASGGQILFPERFDDVTEVFEEIGRTLGRAYSIGYRPKAAVEGEGMRRIIVRVGNHHVRQSRTGYYPQ